MSDKKTDKQQWNWKENIWWISWSVFTLLQVILAFLLYNPDGFKALFYSGWTIMVVGFVIGGLGVSTLRKQGGVPQGKSFSGFGVGSTKIVDSGIYAVVRHPQYLCWIFFSFAIIFVAQDWVITVIGVAAMATIYMQARQDDPSLIDKIGDDYRDYMQKVPRMNLILGIIRLLRRRRKE